MIGCMGNGVRNCMARKLMKWITTSAIPDHFFRIFACSFKIEHENLTSMRALGGFYMI